jgi:hypothetical protein
MKLTTGDIIKHEKFMDVALLIMRIKEVDGHLKFRAMWINQGQNKSWFLPAPIQEFSIDLNDLHLWSKCMNNNAKCVRHEKWEPITEVK